MGYTTTNGFQDLCQAVREGKVVFWVGSGFSEYAGYPTGKDFTKHLQKNLGIPENEKELLSKVSERFENREELLKIIKDVFGKTPENTELHQSLALISQIPYIITTNYDMLFEIAYGDKIKSIADEHELPSTAGTSEKTFIYKIHGDIDHLDQITITSKDYRDFNKTSILWDKIKTIPAEYSVAFVGYSLQDGNVQELLEHVLRHIGEHTNPYYFLTRKLTDEKRQFIQKYNLIPIEMGAQDAINQIKEYVARYAFVDSGTNPILFAKNAPILKHKSVKIRSVIEENQVTECYIDTIPDSGVKTIAMCQKLSSTPDSEDVRDWFNLISGVKFESVTITDPYSKFKFEVQAGDVIVLNPDMNGLKLKTVTLNPHPKKSYSADLQVDSIRFSNVTIKEYESITHCQIVFEHECFIFSLYSQKNQNVAELTIEFELKTQNICLDIDKGKETFSFFMQWFDGLPMNIIRTPPELSKVVESLPVKGSDDYQDIKFRQQLFEILSDIQKISKLKLTIPDLILSEDLQIIFEIGNILHGDGVTLDRISCRMTPCRSTFLDELGEIPHLTIEGIRDFTIFGQKISFNFIVEGTNCAIENIEVVATQFKQGILPLNAVLISKNNDLKLRFKLVQ